MNRDRGRAPARLAPRALLALLTLIALVASACGGDDDGSSGDDSGDSPADTTASDDSTLTVITPAVLSSLDPERYEGNISLDLIPNFGGTLLWWEPPEPDATVIQSPDEIAPALAESWEISEDGKVVTFTLREGAESPYGNQVTSEDVRWSVERMINSEGVPIARILMNQGGWNLEEPIEVVDDRTFRLHIDQPNAVSLSILTTYFTMILDSAEVLQHATEEDPYAYEWLAANDASFGAYTVDSFDPGTQVRLATNPGYWGETPAYEDVVMRAVSDGSSRLQLLQRGEADVGFGLTFDQLTSVQDDPSLQLEQMLFPSIMLLVTNHEVEPFGDPRVREALALAIDRDAIVEGAYQGFGAPARDYFHNAFGFDPAEQPLEQDLDRARNLLAEAGVEDLQLELSYSIGNLGPEVEQIAVLVRDQLAQIGVDVEINNIPSNADFDAGKRDGSLAAWLATSAPQIPDPAYYVQVFYGTDGIVNLMGYSNPELDDLAVDILETQPGPERTALVADANDMMLDDMPSVPLVDTEKYYVFNEGVTGFMGNPQANVEFRQLQPAG
ncbi:MAG: ABC transporter substrate-binding protein [Acidimicrobiales bacterium]|nr:ABC transporter substrate-binding protein [Acidimicrobiales bacterium]